MSNKEVKVPSVSFPTLREGKSTLTEAYKVCVQADGVGKRVKGAQGNVFDVIRYEATQIYRTFLAKANDKPEDIQVKEMVGVFLLKMEDAEKSFEVSDSQKPETWSNYKSKLKLALEKGYNLNENSTVGFNKVSSFLSEKRKEEKEAEENAAKNAAMEGGHADEGNSSQKTGTENSKGTEENGETAGDSLLEGLSDTTRMELEGLIQMARDVEESGDTELTQKLHNVFGSTKTMLSSAHAKALAALTKAAA